MPGKIRVAFGNSTALCKMAGYHILQIGEGTTFCKVTPKYHILQTGDSTAFCKKQGGGYRIMQFSQKSMTSYLGFKFSAGVRRSDGRS